MPQLGMTQDTGVIISWSKRPGDPVKADDILMEVETDKSTMEVEAGRDGFLAELRAEAGTAVPVGEVVAVISATATDATASCPDDTAGSSKAVRRDSDGAADAVKPSPPPVTHANAPAVERAFGKSGATSSGFGVNGRVLASPKAKFEAYRRGIDLTLLAGQGISQPFHVADLEKAEPERWHYEARLSALTATVDRTAFSSFCTWAVEASDGKTSSAAIWAAFATAALRPALTRKEAAQLAVRFETVLAIPSTTTFCDADGQGLEDVAPTEAEIEADLVVLDLIGSGLVDYRSGGSFVPTFTVAESGETLRITLGFDERLLPVAQAAAALAALAARVREPLRHLL